jgi:hypothetical protein
MITKDGTFVDVVNLSGIGSKFVAETVRGTFGGGE